MAKIIDPDFLVVGTNLILDTTAKTFRLVVAGSLTNEGVSLQAVYSKFKELWLTATYQPFPFPMYCIDAEAGKFQFGTDGSNFSGWKPFDDTTRTLLRDGGWEEYDSAGTLTRIYVGIVTLGSVGSTDQLYYQTTAAGAPVNFVFTGAVNEGVQVYGNASNGNFDTRSFFKVFARIQGKTYAQSDLTAIGETQTGPRKLTFAVQNTTDLKITNSDVTADAYGVTITYYGSNQSRTIGGSAYNFNVIINGNNKTAEQIYEAVQSALRKSSDIDAGAGTKTGKTADALLEFVGNTLVTKAGVYIDAFNTNDTNRIEFYDVGNVKRIFPFVAAGTLVFNTNLVSDTAAVYRMYFKTNPTGNYGTANAVTVKNSANADIAGTVNGSGSVAFDFAYDSNTQGGRTAATDATVVIVAIGKNSGKFASVEYTLTRTTGQTISVVAEKERSFSNPV